MKLHFVHVMPRPGLLDDFAAKRPGAGDDVRPLISGARDEMIAASAQAPHIEQSRTCALAAASLPGA